MQRRLKQLLAICRLRLLGQQAWRMRLWWLAYSYPVALVLALFIGLTSLIYGGKPSSRLAALAEGKLLELSLIASRAAPLPATNRDIIVVSAVPTEQYQFKQAPRGRHPDLAADSYALILAKLIHAGVEQIFVAWDLTSHRNNQSYYQDLIEVASKAAKPVTIHLVVDPELSRALPNELLTHVKVLHNISCRDRIDREIFCPYLPEQKNWIHSHLISLTKQNMDSGQHLSRAKGWLTQVLPSNTASFALALPPYAQLRQYTFAELLAEDIDPEVKIAFVGSDASFATSGTAATPMLKTIFDSADISIDVAGTPPHQYWAQLAAMLAHGPYIQFPEPWQMHLVSISLVALILLTMLRKSGTLATSILIFFVIIVLVFNLKLSTVVAWYLPLFDSAYIGLAVLCFAGSGRLSYLSYAQSRLQESSRLHRETADLKTNFISLVSHNLNTPIAKMQSMLGIVQSLAQHATTIASSRQNGELEHAKAHGHLELRQFDQARQLVSQLELLVRFVLHSIALEEGKSVAIARSLDSLSKEFMAEHSPVLKRLGIVLKLKFIADEPELAMMPVQLDPKLTKTALLALAILKLLPPSNLESATIQQTGELQLRIAEIPEQQALGAVLCVVPKYASAAAAQAPQAVQLLTELAQTWLEQYAQAYGGQLIQSSTTEEQLHMEVRWPY